MATKKHKPKKAHKSRKGHRKGSRKGSRKGLSGTSTASKANSMKQALAETGKSTGIGLLGFLASAVAGWGIDKIGFLQSKETDGKVATIFKKAAKPTVLILVGGTGAVIGRKKGIKFLATFSDGFTIGGGYSAAKAIVGSKTNIFNGLGSTDAEVLNKVANYYQENLNNLNEVMKENKMIQKLGMEQENMNGMGSPAFPATDLKLETSGTFI